MRRLRNKDSWQWIAYVSGIGAAVLFLLLLYAPNGNWKLALLIMIIVAVGVMLTNPRYRLLALGTSTVLTGLAGLVAELTATVSATLPSGGTLRGFPSWNTISSMNEPTKAGHQKNNAV